MTDNFQTDPNNPPESFVQDIREALEHLYDFPFLQTHPLTNKLGEFNRRPNETGGQHLRRLMIEAIEASNPGSGVGFRAPSARLYNLLHLRYVEGMLVKDAARELGLSLRQAYRDLEHGIENISTLLWQNVQPVTSTLGPNSSEIPYKDDMDRLVLQYESIDLMDLLAYATQAVERLAQQQGVELINESERTEIVLSTDRILARQVLTTLLSRVIQQSARGFARCKLKHSEDEIVLTIRYSIRPESIPVTQPNSVLSQLVDRLGWQFNETIGQPSIISLTIKNTSRLLLIIDDNEGLVGLVKRYLDNSICQLASANNPRDGLRMAQELKPDAILLDVMMPEMDGWEVLQRLKNHPMTKHIPVIVCSVLNDPELALSLGANYCLPKPMNPETFLAALKKLGLL